MGRYLKWVAGMHVTDVADLQSIGRDNLVMLWEKMTHQLIRELQWENVSNTVKMTHQLIRKLQW